MSPWPQDAPRPRRGGREQSDRWKGEGEADSPSKQAGPSTRGSPVKCVRSDQRLRAGFFALAAFALAAFFTGLAAVFGALRMAARAAASRAMGTRKGEQLT